MFYLGLHIYQNNNFAIICKFMVGRALIFLKSNANHRGLNGSDIVAFSINLRTKCVFWSRSDTPPLVCNCMHYSVDLLPPHPH